MQTHGDKTKLKAALLVNLNDTKSNWTEVELYKQAAEHTAGESGRTRRRTEGDVDTKYMCQTGN